MPQATWRQRLRPPSGKACFSGFLSVATQQRLCCCQGEHLVAAVVKMLSSVYMVFDFELAYGRILETL